MVRVFRVSTHGAGSRKHKREAFLLNLHSLLQDRGLAWLRTMLEHHNPKDLAKHHWRPLRDAFLKKYALQVRPASVTAREQLVSGAVRQGTSSLDDYIDRFQTLLERCGDLPITLQCEYFRQGLTSELAAACMGNAHGGDWDNLDELLRRAHLEARRMAARPTPPRPPAAATPKLFNRQYNRPHYPVANAFPLLHPQTQMRTPVQPPPQGDWVTPPMIQPVAAPAQVPPPPPGRPGPSAFHPPRAPIAIHKSNPTLNWGLGLVAGKARSLTPHEKGQLRSDSICTRCRGVSFEPGMDGRLAPTYGYHANSMCPWQFRRSAEEHAADHREFMRIHPTYCTLNLKR